MKLLFLSLIAVNMLVNCAAQTYQKDENAIYITGDSLKVHIQFFTSSIVRVAKYRPGPDVAKESLCVIKTPGKVVFTAKQKGDLIEVKTDKLTINVTLPSGDVTYFSRAGDLLLKEKARGAAFRSFIDAGNKTYSVSQSFVLDREEAIYGLGQQQQGKMIQRNLVLNMVQGNTDDYIPFFQSVKGYGVFWDNYSPTRFADNSDSTSFRSEVGDLIDYYFMYGGNADGVIACMRDLTGQAPMFPLWTYGYWQSRERYKSQDELVDVVKKYRQLGVPIDGIIQDWQYWGNNYLWNAMEFLNPEFYNPQKMVNDVHNLNAHMIISIWNSFGPHTKQYKELEKINALLDFRTWPESGSEKWPPNPDYPSGVRVYDPYNPEARKIYWNYLKKGIFTLGMDGWWMDSSEPDHLQFKRSDFDNKTYLGSFRKVRNAFPLMTVGGVAQHQRAETSNKRVFILTRSAFAGQQRYGANTWSGDVVASWDALRNQISAGLNFSLCGVPYWNSDIGGFFLWKYPKKLRDAEYRELYVRWLQFGAFCPMMRSHGADAPREIYQFGTRGEKAYDAIDKFIKLRYRLLPYIYSVSWDVTSRQSSMMRALVMDFPHDKNALGINDQYMFGKSLLVCPVTRAMYVKPVINGKDTSFAEDFSTTRSTELYLPKGTGWYDFWTGEKMAGGQSIKKPVSLDQIPVYVKAGSIIPWGPVVQYATEQRWSDLSIRIYPGADGEFTLYEDENDNYNYEAGAYSTITFRWNDKNRTITIGNRSGTFEGILATRTFNLVVVDEKNGTGDEPGKAAKIIRYDGSAQTIKL